MVTRWTITNPATSSQSTFTFNPSSVQLPSNGKDIEYAVDDYGTVIILDLGDSDQLISFSGTVLTEAMYDQLRTFYGIDNQVVIQDHLGRSFQMVISKLTMERVHTPFNPWLHTYQMDGIVLGVTSVPVDNPVSVGSGSTGSSMYGTNYGTDISPVTVTITGSGVKSFYPAISGTTRGDFLGISTGLHWLEDYTQSQRLADITYFDSLGVKWVHMYSTGGSADVTALVSAVHTAGMYAIGRVAFTSATTTGAVDTAVTNAVNAGFDVIEIGAEPNVAATYGTLSYSNYETRLLSGITAATTASFSGPIISASMGPYGPLHTQGTTVDDGTLYVDNIYAGSAAVDGWGWHPYCSPQMPTGTDDPGARAPTHISGYHGWRLMEEVAYNLEAETANVMYAMEFGANTEGSGSVPAADVAAHFQQAARRFTTLQYVDWEGRVTTRAATELGVLCFYAYRADLSAFASEYSYEFRFNTEALAAIASVAAEAVS